MSMQPSIAYSDLFNLLIWIDAFRHLSFLRRFSVRSINFLTPNEGKKESGMRNAVFPMSDYTSDYITVFYEKIANFKSLRVYQK